MFARGVEIEARNLTNKKKRPRKKLTLSIYPAAAGDPVHPVFYI